MTVLVRGASLRTALFGTLVERAAATIPQTATQSIFTVAGGRIVVTGLVGEVTTAIGAVATTLSIGLTPTVGSSSLDSVSSASAITSKQVGVLLAPALTAGNGLAVGTNAGFPVQIAGSAFTVPAGSITITTSASTTGAIKWALLYVPLDADATVAAA